MYFHSVVRFISGMIGDVMKFLVRFDGYQEMIFGWFFIIGMLMTPIITFLIIKDVVLTLKIQTREEAAKELMKL